jgi:hypothetical protein
MPEAHKSSVEYHVYRPESGSASPGQVAYDLDRLSEEGWRVVTSMVQGWLVLERPRS